MTKNQFRAVPIFFFFFFFFFFVLFFFVFTVRDALYGPSSTSPVLRLTPSNFKSKVLDSDGVVLVVFYAPWCVHSQTLSPIWEKAATVLKGVATLAAVDTDAHKSLARDYGIMGFPTIKVFVPGKPPVIYTGARAVEPIADFALSQVLELERAVRVTDGKK